MTPKQISKTTHLDETQLTREEIQSVNHLISSTLGPRRRINSDDMDDLMLIKEKKMEQGKRLKGLFTSIGFVISLMLIIGAFEWKSYNKISTIDLTYSGANFEVMAEIPQTEQPPPPPPAAQIAQVIFTEVPDEQIIEEIKVDLDVEITTEMTVSDVIITPLAEPEEEVAEEIFTLVENYPEPIGGYEAFYSHVRNNLVYPTSARKAGIEGKVFVQFVVEPTGEISNVRVAKGIGMGCDESAIKALSSSPQWKPGKQRGIPVRVRMIVPIIFKVAK